MLKRAVVSSNLCLLISSTHIIKCSFEKTDGIQNNLIIK